MQKQVVDFSSLTKISASEVYEQFTKNYQYLITEFFETEEYRLGGGYDLTNTEIQDAYADETEVLANQWDPTQNLKTGGAAHTDGLMCFDGSLVVSDDPGCQ